MAEDMLTMWVFKLWIVEEVAWSGLELKRWIHSGGELITDRDSKVCARRLLIKRLHEVNHIAWFDFAAILEHFRGSRAKLKKSIEQVLLVCVWLDMGKHLCFIVQIKSAEIFITSFAILFFVGLGDNELLELFWACFRTFSVVQVRMDSHTFHAEVSDWPAETKQISVPS